MARVIQPATFRPSIPTIYKGTRFRSKLEADWARCFDAHGVVWRYEDHGVYCGETFVCPDFWLPKAGQYFEVKAVLHQRDVPKFSALARHIAKGAGECPPFIVFGWPDGVLSLAWADGPDGLAFCADSVALVACLACGVRYFIDTAGSWTCAACGRNADGVEWVRSQGPPVYRWSGWPKNHQATR